MELSEFLVSCFAGVSDALVKYKAGFLVPEIQIECAIHGLGEVGSGKVFVCTDDSCNKKNMIKIVFKLP